MDEFMETIPYDETRNYTKRVLASYFTYSWLYGTNPVPGLPLAARGKPPAPDDGERGKHSHAGRTTGSRRESRRSVAGDRDFARSQLRRDEALSFP
jgi:hypothetical protein